MTIESLYRVLELGTRINIVDYETAETMARYEDVSDIHASLMNYRIENLFVLGGVLNIEIDFRK